MTDQSTVTTLWASASSWLSFTPTTLFLFLNLVIGTIAISSRFHSASKTPQQDQDRHQTRPGPGGLARAPSLLDRVKSINLSLYKFPSHEYEQHQHQDQEPEQDYFRQPTFPAEPEQPPQLARAPSLLDRVKSINFSVYKFPSYPAHEQDPKPESNWFHSEQGHYDTNQYHQPEQPPLARAPSLIERVKSIKFPSVYRSQDIDHEETEKTNHPAHKAKRTKSETKKTKPKVQRDMKKSVSERSMMVGPSAEEETETVEQRRPQTARLDRTDSIGEGDHGVDAKADDFINKFKKQLRLQRLDSLLRYKEILQGK